MIIVSCAPRPAVPEADITSGKYLKGATLGNVWQYFALFAIDQPQDKKSKWKILFKDDDNIYYGFVHYGLFDKGSVNAMQFHKVSLKDMQKYIPLYDKGELNALLRAKIDLPKLEIEDANIIERRGEINYQIQLKAYMAHFEMGEKAFRELIITDTNFNIIDEFFLCLLEYCK
jgi:hypothetical protein